MRTHSDWEQIKRELKQEYKGKNISLIQLINVLKWYGFNNVIEELDDVERIDIIPVGAYIHGNLEEDKNNYDYDYFNINVELVNYNKNDELTSIVKIIEVG